MSIHSPVCLSTIALFTITVSCTGAHPMALSASAADAATTTAATSKPADAAASPLARTAAELVGTWDCSGSVFGPEGPSPSKVTLIAAPALDGTWLRTGFVVTSGKYPYKFDAYRTFAAGRWSSLIVDNQGGHTVAQSADGITWTGMSTSPMGDLQIKDSETMLSPGKMTMLGHYSLDGGTSWNPGYELSCAK